MPPAELKQRRHAMGMSQAQLAAALGVDPNTVGSWEAGRNAIPPYLHLALDALAHPAMLTPTEVATRLGVAPRTVIDWIRRGRLSASTIPGPGGDHYRVASADLRVVVPRRANKNRPIAPALGVRNGRSKLSERDAQAILDSPRGRGAAAQLAARHCVTTVTVHSIWRRATWKHLTPRFATTPTTEG
jgi:excisionase family DNA binding protein